MPTSTDLMATVLSRAISGEVTRLRRGVQPPTSQPGLSSDRASQPVRQ